MPSLLIAGMKSFGAQQIARLLGSDIMSGRIPMGARLPTRQELMARYGVARATVDRAVQSLAQRGQVETRRSAGTIVVSRAPPRQIAVLGSLIGTGGLPSRPGIRTVLMDPVRCRAARFRADVAAFDGIIWHCPGEEQLACAARIGDGIPQIVVNRSSPGLNYVSTDHAGAIYGITRDRLGAHPGCRPVFLGLREPHEVVRLRQEGFVAACREASVFCDIVQMPASFKAKCDLLERQFRAISARPLLLVSGAFQNTGAVMHWAGRLGLRWGRDVLYSDFDNTMPEHVWGVTVTSFLQDYAGMLDMALSSLAGMLDGRVERLQVLRPALPRPGRT